MTAYNTKSLFSGAMGLDLSIEKVGFKIRVCVEKDKWAAQTIRANTSIPVIERDINDVHTDEILAAAGIGRQDVTLVIGGPPCQAFSTAGKQKGFADFRGNVMLQYLRVVRDILPEFFIMENVRGLQSAKLNSVPAEYAEYEPIKDVKGSAFHFMVAEFRKLGYSISHALLNAANYGVPEKRERIVVIGHRGERVPIPSPTHSENGELGTKKWNTLRSCIGDMEHRTDLHYTELRKRSLPYMKILKEGQNWRNQPEDMAMQAMGKAYFLSGGKTGFLRRLKFDEPSPTLVTSPTMPATLLCHPHTAKAAVDRRICKDTAISRLMDFQRAPGNHIQTDWQRRARGIGPGRRATDNEIHQRTDQRKRRSPQQYTSFKVQEHNRQGFCNYVWTTNIQSHENTVDGTIRWSDIIKFNSGTKQQ